MKLDRSIPSRQAGTAEEKASPSQSNFGREMAPWSRITRCERTTIYTSWIRWFLQVAESIGSSRYRRVTHLQDTGCGVGNATPFQTCFGLRGRVFAKFVYLQTIPLLHSFTGSRDVRSCMQAPQLPPCFLDAMYSTNGSLPAIHQFCLFRLRFD